MKTFSSKLFHLFDIHYFTRILPTIFVYYTVFYEQSLLTVVGCLLT